MIRSHHLYRLTGRIPTQVGLFPKLESFLINDNRRAVSTSDVVGIAGTVPNSMAFLTNLIEARLDGNDLRGTFPANVVPLTNLLYLYIHDNRLREERRPM